jgi:hypothetical protein
MTLSGSTGHHWIETVDKRFMMLPAKCSLLMLKACAKPPTEQIEAAEKAIKVVQANDTSTHIPDEYTKIEGTLSALKEEVTHQGDKLALFRDYGKIWQLAVTEKSEAERLKTKGTEKKETKASALQAQQVAQEAVTAPLALVCKSADRKRSRRIGSYQSRWRSPIGICQSGADSNRHSRLSDHTNSGESHSRKESGRFSQNRDSPCQDRREKTPSGEEEVR